MKSAVRKLEEIREHLEAARTLIKDLATPKSDPAEIMVQGLLSSIVSDSTDVAGALSICEEFRRDLRGAYLREMKSMYDAAEADAKRFGGTIQPWAAFLAEHAEEGRRLLGVRREAERHSRELKSMYDGAVADARRLGHPVPRFADYRAAYDRTSRAVLATVERDGQTCKV